MNKNQKLLLESPQLQEEKNPSRSSKSSSGSYLLHITSLGSYYAASSSSPSNVIDLFDKSTLRGIQTLPGHEQGTTSLHTIENLSGVLSKCLVSSGKDRTIKVWDERSNSCSIQMTNSGHPHGFLCCDVSLDGMTIAGGTELRGEDAFIAYWDPRQPAAPLRMHGSTHSDDITTLTFCPEKEFATGRNIILSGSTDGLLSTSYADEDDEDESTIQVGNLGTSISQAGWVYGAVEDTSQAAIWAATDMETFSTWTNELDHRMSLDIRAPILDSGHVWSTDYFIKAHSSSTCNPKLSIFTGNNSGDVALLSNMNPSAPDAPWCLHKLWRQGHEGVVRGLFWDEPTQILVTGGEDSKLNAWKIDTMTLDDYEIDSDTEITERGHSETMTEVEMASPKSKKRDRKGGFEKTGKKARYGSS